MGLGHKWITREFDLSELGTIKYARPDNLKDRIKEVETFLQEGLSDSDTWDEYFDLKLKHITDDIIRYAMNNSNYYRFIVNTINGKCSQGRHVRTGIHFYLHPCFDAKESFYIELKSKDYRE